MDSENIKSEATSEELERCYRTAMLTVAGFIVLTVLLVAIAFLATNAITRPGDAWAVGALRIAGAIFGVGAIVHRRIKFAPMRLQDIAGVRGTSGLLHTLKMGTIELASIGGAIALMGFMGTVLSGSPLEMLYLGVVALAILLLYSFPKKGAWKKLVESIQQQDIADATTKGTLA